MKSECELCVKCSVRSVKSSELRQCVGLCVCVYLCLCVYESLSVCVCNPWNHRDPFGFVRSAFLDLFSQQGVAADHLGPLPTKTPT